jgi:LmbE family N-acetylglucosaminyl deacetylase
MKTILGIGAHYDDCVFGIPGILLKAVRKNYRVVILSLVGDYRNWKPGADRAQELVEKTGLIGKEYGVEMLFLDYAGMRFGVTEESKRKVAEAVAAIEPHIAFQLWPHDHHTDHEMASQLAKVALRHGDRVLDVGPKKSASRMYWFDNGPGHTIGFEPNTFVDVTDEWPRAIEWLGRLMAMQANKPYDPKQLDGAQQTKEAIARYRGISCGVKYAEAVRSTTAYPVDIF